MLVSEAPASEKLATRMLYSFACARIQSAAATTSLVLDWPSALAVRIETIGALGAPPGYVPEPAARPATIVPCPSLSPTVSVQSEHMLIDVDLIKFDGPGLERLALAAYADAFRHAARDSGAFE